MEIHSPFMCPNARGPFCLLQLLAHAGILPHRISFPRGTKHDYLLCIAFSYHFLSKEVNKKWHLVLSIVWCSLMALLCESTARQSPLPSQVIIGMADYRHILSEQPLPSTEFTCSKEKCDDYSKTPSLQSWPGFFCCMTPQLWGLPWVSRTGVPTLKAMLWQWGLTQQDTVDTQNKEFQQHSQKVKTL